MLLLLPSPVLLADRAREPIRGEPPRSHSAMIQMRAPQTVENMLFPTQTCALVLGVGFGNGATLNRLLELWSSDDYGAGASGCCSSWSCRASSQGAASQVLYAKLCWSMELRDYILSHADQSQKPVTLVPRTSVAYRRDDVTYSS